MRALCTQSGGVPTLPNPLPKREGHQTGIIALTSSAYGQSSACGQAPEGWLVSATRRWPRQRTRRAAADGRKC